MTVLPARPDAALAGAAFTVALVTREGRSPWDVVSCGWASGRCVCFDDIAKAVSKMVYEERPVFLVEEDLLHARGTVWSRFLTSSGIGPVLLLMHADDDAQRHRGESGLGVLPYSILDAEPGLAAAVLDQALVSWESQQWTEDRFNETQEHVQRAVDSSGRSHARLVDLDRTLRDALHEFRTCLTSVIGFAEIVRSGASGPLEPEQSEQLGHVLDCARDMGQLLDDLRDTVRLVTGSLPGDPARHSVEELFDVVQHAAPKRPTLSARVDPGAERAWFDLGQAVTVLLRMARFAGHWSDPGSTLHLRARRITGDVELALRYEGACPDEELATLLRAPQWGRENLTGRLGVGVELAARLVASWGTALELEQLGAKEVVLRLRLPVDRPRGGGQ